MAELRRDPFSNRWVIVSPARALRPQGAGPADVPAPSGPCPFCPGNEHLTPPEIASTRDGNAWRVRVVPNKYPVLSTDGELERHGVGPYDAMSGTGAHEVIVETPAHDGHLSTLGAAALVDVLATWQARLLDLAKDPRLAHALLFKNHGARAGATLAHSHSQLVALPFVPPAVETELATSAAHHARTGRCLSCDVLRHELGAGERIVSASDDVVVLAPWAARGAFELSIVPRRHAPAFQRMDAPLRAAVADALALALRRIDAALDRPAYHLILHTAPLRQEPASYHWHLELLPVLAHVAGFELGTGAAINPTPPEEVARFLRTLP